MKALRFRPKFLNGLKELWRRTKEGGIEVLSTAPQYARVAQQVKANHKHVTFGIRNAVEQAFRSLKHRLKIFHNFKYGSKKRTALNWIKAYTTILNIINTIARR